MSAKTNLALLFLSAIAACQMISGAEDFDFGTATSSAGGAASSAGAGGTSGDGGGAVVECHQPQDCPGAETTCAVRTCVDQMCGMAGTQATTPCTEDGGQVCDGVGACVECLKPEDCEDTETCDKKLCVPAVCANQALDPGETDVDCGGTLCAPCDNDLGCLVASDCVSLYCADNSGAGGAGPAKICAACGNNTNCDEAPSTYCNAGACVPKKMDGVDCDGAGQCDSGHCVDGVCCDSSCVGECVACHIAKTNVASGNCSPIPMGDDPDNECILACSGMGTCTL